MVAFTCILNVSWYGSFVVGYIATYERFVKIVRIIAEIQRFFKW